MKSKHAVVLAFEQWKKGDVREAARIFDIVLQAEPMNALALYGLGSIAMDNKALSTAKILLERAVQADPDADWAWHNLGIAHKQVQDTDAAEAAYRRALNINPRRADTMAMISGCYVNNGTPKKAIEWADKALDVIAMDPSQEEHRPHATNHKALALLELSRWEEGWDLWLERWDVPERHAMLRNYRCPKWDWSPFETLVVHGEQGLGDEILFMSCFDDLKRDYDGRVIIECAKPLVTTFRRSFGLPTYGTPEEVLASEKPTAWISMGDLPAKYRRTDESFDRQKPFLKADPVRVSQWRDKLEEEDGPHIGIAWWGGVSKTHSKLRNAPLGFWKDLVEKIPAHFVSVQYDTGDTVEEARQFGVVHYPECGDPRDMDDRVALMDACDMIVTVCQTAHHVAGALGKPCFTLVPNAPAWRYGLKGEGNVWYPSVRQIRGDWEDVFERLEDALRGSLG